MMDRNGEAFPDASPEVSGEGRWLTYDEISQIRGIGRESAVKLAQRERWQRQPGNDGTARILVPLDWLKPARPRSPERSPEASPELSRVVGVLEVAIATLRERAEAAERRADRAEQARETAEARAAHEREDLLDAESRARRAMTDLQVAEQRARDAEQGRDDERGRADAFRAQLEGLQTELAAAQAAVEQARTLAKAARDRAEAIEQAEDARRSLSRLARLRRAWRRG
jgi:DNA repair exonuclease SbcCD ATPase subunit